MPRISICLPVFNGANYVEEALASIAAQTWKDYVVLASDNASSDETGAILKKWSGRIPMDIVAQEKTIPMQAHFDSVLNRINSDAYMLLCHDDFFHTADALENALAVLDNQPSVSAVYCDLSYVSERGTTIATRRFKRAGAMDANMLGKQSIRSARNMFGIPLLVRTAALGDLRYDGRFKYIVDVDLSWTISKDTQAWHIPEVMIANRYSASNSTWGMLKDSAQEFMALAEKHDILLTPADRMKIRFTSWYIGMCKNMFGAYERVRTRMGV